MSRCCCHPEGTVRACCYCFPIVASKATDSCGTRNREKQEKHERRDSKGPPIHKSRQENPYLFPLLGRGLPGPLAISVFHSITARGQHYRPASLSSHSIGYRLWTPKDAGGVIPEESSLCIQKVTPFFFLPISFRIFILSFILRRITAIMLTP